METQSTPPSGVAPHSSPSSAGGNAPLVETPLERQRRIWRDQKRRRRAEMLAASLPPGAAPPPPVARGSADPAPAANASIPGSAQATGGSAPSNGVVPWTPDILRPLFEQIVPAAEKADVASLVARAAPLGAEICNEIRRDASWNPVSKTTLVATGPAAVAKIMNSTGISAEHSDLALFLAAVSSIVFSRTTLASKIEEMVAQKKCDAPPAPAN